MMIQQFKMYRPTINIFMYCTVTAPRCKPCAKAQHKQQTITQVYLFEKYYRKNAPRGIENYSMSRAKSKTA